VLNIVVVSADYDCSVVVTIVVVGFPDTPYRCIVSRFDGCVDWHLLFLVVDSVDCCWVDC